MEEDETVVLEEDDVPNEIAQSSSASSCSSDDGFGSSGSHQEFKHDYPQAPQNSPNYADKAKSPAQTSLISNDLSNELTQLCRVTKQHPQLSVESDGLLSDESGFCDSKNQANEESDEEFNELSDPARQVQRILQQNCQVTAL